jgi:Domain of unknown function (DUF4411)
MLAFDASSIIYAWDNYPEKQFPPLWRWISANMENGEFVMAQIAFEEVAKKSPECARFLKDAGLKQVKISNAIVQEALRIKGRLGITNDDYHSDGVGENDIFIIATAKLQMMELVSEEGRQTKQPRENRRLKIPRVCSLPDVGVKCISFRELIVRSDQVFQ